MNQIDVAIIGAGTSGLSARSVVANHTDSYKVFDAGILGTTCARVGCMPSKVLIQSANDFHRRLKLQEEGISGGENLTLDINQTFKHVRSLRDRFVRGVTESMSQWQDRYLIREYVHLRNENTLETESGELYEAKKIIIATGSKPFVPQPFKGFESYCIDTDGFFEIQDVPKRWLVIGNGVIGMELGQALDRLGCDVSILARRRSMAGITDPEVMEYAIEKIFDDCRVVFGHIEGVEEHNGCLQIKTKDASFDVDKVLLAAGRLPSIRNLKLSEIGLETNPHGVPKFDPETMLVRGTTHLFIAGDCNGEKAILHEAADEGRIAGINAVQESPQRYKRRAPLGITFTDPNICYVGMKYRELVDQDYPFQTGKVSFEGQGRAIVKLKEKGLLHVYAHQETGEILGAEMFAPEGEHLAHLLSWAISEQWTVDQTLSKPFYHPVVQEGLRTALRAIKKGDHEIEIPEMS